MRRNPVAGPVSGHASFPLPHDQNEQMATVFMSADAFDELQASVGEEIGADYKPEALPA